VIITGYPGGYFAFYDNAISGKDRNALCFYRIATIHLHLTNALRIFTASRSRSSSASFSKLLIISFSSLVFLASWANSKKSVITHRIFTRYR